MLQIVEQTKEEKMAMYMKLPKKQIAEMLISCNDIITALTQAKNCVIPAVSNRRELFDKFYEWLDGLSQKEYDDMSLTDKCEKFFFKT